MAVLIVDDRPSIRRHHRLWLQAQARWSDGSIVECATLEQAVQAARSGPVEFVSLDLNLSPEHQGVDTLRRFLRESGVPPNKVFVITADSDNIDLIHECIALGVADVTNPGSAPWASPPQIFTDAQLAELQRQITTSISTVLSKTIEAEFRRLQEEQARRDALKQHEGILKAMKAVGGAICITAGGWVLTSAAPVAVKAIVASLMTGGKTQ